MSRLRPPLNSDDLKVIFDVLNVYDPNDIQHVYPEMGEKEFLDEVRIAWHKVLAILQEDGVANFPMYNFSLDNSTEI